MRSADAPGRHLSPDEIVDRVFPSGDEPVPAALHLAACADCQEKLGRVRDALILDRGAVAGVLEALPPTFWKSQEAAILQTVAEAAENRPAHPIPFSLHRTLFRRPALAFGSLAAAVLLVTGISVTHVWNKKSAIAEGGRSKPTAVALTDEQKQDITDDELLESIDTILTEDAAVHTLVPEGIS